MICLHLVIFFRWTAINTPFQVLVLHRLLLLWDKKYGRVLKLYSRVLTYEETVQLVSWVLYILTNTQHTQAFVFLETIRNAPTSNMNFFYLSVRTSAIVLGSGGTHFLSQHLGGRSLNWRPAWSIKHIPGHLRLYRESLLEPHDTRQKSDTSMFVS